VLEEVLPDYWSRIHNLMDGLTPTEMTTLIELLNKLAGRIIELTRE
jgi:hypothetical protein